ncbi:hypothetical protein [Rhizobium sullae]|nr:hypothetical protein [Rhizobium sullae]
MTDLNDSGHNSLAQALDVARRSVVGSFAISLAHDGQDSGMFVAL